MILCTSTEKGNRSAIAVSRSANAHICYSLQCGGGSCRSTELFCVRQSVGDELALLLV